MLYKSLLALLVLSLLNLLIPVQVHADTTLLNVSYDVTREFYKDYNPAFAQYWKQKSGETVSINQSHGGSSKQARAVLEGLEADVITMNQASDIDVLHDKGHLIPADWAKRLPNNSSPTSSVTVLLVRKGNPKHIKDWDDLVKPGTSVVAANPKTSGNGRYAYLAAYGYALKKGGDDAKAADFVKRLFKNVPVLDTGGRGATTTFVQRGIGDVLITFENEVSLIKGELGGDQFEVVYPSISVRAENPVTVVDKFANKHKTQVVAQAYLQYLYSDEGQEIAARHHLRPVSEAIAAKHAADFPKLDLFTVNELFGSWKQVEQKHFADGGVFDQIYSK